MLLDALLLLLYSIYVQCLLLFPFSFVYAIRMAIVLVAALYRCFWIYSTYLLIVWFVSFTV